jgi:SAM-dependent methyltransferase
MNEEPGSGRPGVRGRPPRGTESIVFHDLQQGGRTSDLPYYCELARRADSTLELGAGTGRVALELSPLTDVWANELDERLMQGLVLRAEARGLSVTAVLGDAAKLDLGRRFDLILAPIGLAQTVGGQGTRRRLLRVIARHLAVTGLAVVALVDVDEVLRECATPAARQRLRARGRTFVCQQLAATETEGGTQVTWKRGIYRRTAGRLTARAVEPAVLTYHRVRPEDLAADARTCGLHVPHVHHDPGDETSLGSTYCVLHQAHNPGLYGARRVEIQQ